MERVNGSIRRKCLDQIKILNARHLRRVPKKYMKYYHEHGTPLGLDKDAPITRDVEDRDTGNVVAVSFLGGLHHRYIRLAE